MLAILLRATLLFVLAAIAGAALRRSAASTRHLLWALSLGGALVLPVVASLFAVEWRVLPPRELRSTAPTPPAPNATTPPRSGSTPAMPDALVTPVTPATPVVTGVTTVGLTEAGTAVYAGGVLLLLGWLGIGLLVVRRRAMRATVLDVPEWTDEMRTVATSLGLRRTPQLRRSTDATAPFVTGLVQPVVVLPANSDTWSANQRRAVLLHEAAHISRGDLAMNLLAYVTRAVYWINPLAWLAARRLRVEGEKACDDVVIAEGARPSDYADHLLHLVRNQSHNLPQVALAMARGSDFEGRLLSILAPDVPRRRLTRQRLVAAGTLATIAVASIGAVSPVRAAAPVVLPTAPVSGSDDIDQTAETSTDRERPVSHEASTDAARHQEPRPRSTVDANATVNGLISLLDDANSEVRLAAIQSLHNLQDPAAIAALAKALKEDVDPRVREAAADALGEIDDTRAVPHLIEAMRTERVTRVKVQILEAIHELDDPRAAPTAIAALRDAAAEVRRAAVHALQELDDHSAVGAIEALARDPDVEVRRHVAEALGDFEAPGSLATLLAMVRDADAEVRASAIGALDDYEDARVTPVLVTALGDANADVRQHAAEGLGNVEGLKVAPRALIDALSDTNGDVRRSAANALGSIGDEAAVPALKRMISTTDVETRRQVVEALKDIGGVEATEALLGLLKDSDAEIRKMAAEALGKRRGES